MHNKARMGIAMRDDLSKQEVILLHIMQKMRKEMDLAWKDFFEKNPGMRKEDVWRRLEERLRSKQIGRMSKGEEGKWGRKIFY